MTFIYPRQIRFHETDAAGVVYFAQVLMLCHEAYEASLDAAGIELKTFFSGQGSMAVPIVHSSVDFFRPLFCGDRLTIHLDPQPLNESEFEIHYEIWPAPSFPAQPDKTSAPSRPCATALTRHVCINPACRRRLPWAPILGHWLKLAQESTPVVPTD